MKRIAISFVHAATLFVLRQEDPKSNGVDQARQAMREAVEAAARGER